MHYWGMHLFWWFLWIAIIISFFSFLIPVPRKRMRMITALGSSRGMPLDVLQRRYAAGEITQQEYEERKQVLERDS